MKTWFRHVPTLTLGDSSSNFSLLRASPSLWDYAAGIVNGHTARAEFLYDNFCRHHPHLFPGTKDFVLGVFRFAIGIRESRYYISE